MCTSYKTLLFLSPLFCKCKREIAHCLTAWRTVSSLWNVLFIGFPFELNFFPWDKEVKVKSCMNDFNTFPHLFYLFFSISMFWSAFHTTQLKEEIRKRNFYFYELNSSLWWPRTCCSILRTCLTKSYSTYSSPSPRSCRVINIKALLYSQVEQLLSVTFWFFFKSSISFFLSLKYWIKEFWSRLQEK